ncbi:TetR/AcrR family transcriptional regulator [Agromyces protaetiae]|uniref:TetR/AcrR family transcriptional regulator n=1 Tax=Agromyces protaetiae TaxID=2509455 RepID=UPI0013EB6E95|nr:TetR/AcrR family transcriptional regulator [Agromyces protaetiae]
MLDAATKLILEKGTAVTLAQVATAAGVSKSGLIHHFGDRDQLVVAVVDDMYAQFREAVLAQLDLSENHPGKMLRAYVRALCTGSADAAAARDFTSAANWNGVAAVPGVASVIAEQAEWWHEQLAADGLSAELIQIVRRAAEGIAAAALQGGEDEASIARARDLLLDLSTQGTFSTPL